MLWSSVVDGLDSRRLVFVDETGTHLHGSLVWLLVPWAEGLFQDPEKQGYEYYAACEHELGGHGTFDGC